MNQKQRDILAEQADILRNLVPECADSELANDQRHTMATTLDQVRLVVEDIRGDEEDKYSNMTEGAQNSERGEKMSEGIESLGDVISEIESAVTELLSGEHIDEGTVTEPLETAISALESV